MSKPVKSCAVLAAVFIWAAAMPAVGGELLDKAQKYDEHYQAFHAPGLGGTVEVRFADESLSTPVRYLGLGDSTIHTGAYLAAESFRWAATKDPAAKDNAIRAARALHAHLAVTGKKGFIARYAGPARPPYIESVEACRKRERCRLVDGGTRDGFFWLGYTSRDQYDGWFFGNAIAFDLVDDPATRAMIRGDMKEVMDFLHRTGFIIVDVNGLPTSAGAVSHLPTFRTAWELIAAHVIDEPAYWARCRSRVRLTLPAVALEYLEVPGHAWYQYYALMFFQRGGYNIIRLEPSEAGREYYRLVYEAMVRPWVQGTDNVFFDYSWMVIRGEPDLEVMDRDREALGLFPEPPNRDLCINPPPAPLEPLSAAFAWTGLVERRAVKPYPINQQCGTDFLWQRSPYKAHCCQDSDPARVFPGVDYLLAYWMGRWHGFLSEDD